MTFSWNFEFFMQTHQLKTGNQKSSEQHQKDTEMIPEVRWSFNVFFLEKVKNLLRFDDTHQVNTGNQKSSEPHQKDTEMIPEVRWRFYCFSLKSENLIKQTRPRWEKHESRRTPNSASVDPQTQNPSYSTPVDPQSSKFDILGPGRARAQNSSESQNFGVMKKPSLQERFLENDRLDNRKTVSQR